MGIIKLTEIKAYGRHGVYEEEQLNKQLFLINVELEMDLSRAQKSDCLEDTLDYAVLHSKIVQTIENTSYFLLERLGQDLMDIIFQDRRVQRAKVSLTKPGILSGSSPTVILQGENVHHD